MTTIRRQPSAVWSDDESRLLRRKSRLFERRYRRTGLASDRLLSVQHERTRHEVNRIKENGYWLARISEHSGQPSKLWRTFPSIMGLDRVTITTNGSATAQSSLDFFVEKIETIRRSTSGSPATTKLPPATSTFDGFQELSVDEVYRFIA